MKRDKIIEILGKIGANVYIPYDVKCNLADAILAIPIDVPTKREIEIEAIERIDSELVWIDACNWIRNEIIKRNK